MQLVSVPLVNRPNSNMNTINSHTDRVDDVVIIKYVNIYVTLRLTANLRFGHSINRNWGWWIGVVWPLGTARGDSCMPCVWAFLPDLQVSLRERKKGGEKTAINRRYLHKVTDWSVSYTLVLVRNVIVWKFECSPCSPVLLLRLRVIQTKPDRSIVRAWDLLCMHKP